MPLSILAEAEYPQAREHIMTYLESQLQWRNQLLSQDLIAHPNGATLYRQLKAVEERIEVLSKFIDSTDFVFEVLTKRAFEKLQMDADKYADYELLRKKVSQLILESQRYKEQAADLRRQSDFWRNDSTYWMEVYENLLRSVVERQSAPC